MVRFLLLIVIFSAFVVPAYCQNSTGDVKFRLAQSYERSGDYESAMKLYQELYSKDTTNVVIFDALQRIYAQLKKYGDAIALFTRRLSENPNDTYSWARLGTIYNRASNEAKANEAWDKAIAVAPKVETTYRVVASSMIEARALDKAINVYLRGRAGCGDPLLFINDLAYLYASMLKYPEATHEYLILLRQNPGQLSYVQTRIASYTGRTEGLTATTLAVEREASAEPNIISFQQLLAWLYMEGKNFDRAFETYKLIDTKMNASGHQLYYFAELALREKAYAAASKAFLAVLNSYPKFDFMPQVKFGYARTLEESSTATDTLHLFGNTTPFHSEQPATESEPVYRGVLAAYERVINEYPQTEIAAQSLYRLGIMNYGYLFDLDGAKKVLESIERDYAKFSNVRAEATLLCGDVVLTMGNLDLASAKYNSITTLPAATGEQQNTAALRSAEIDYFEGKFQEALNKLNDLTKNPISDITNDALSLRIFIQENMKPTEQPLKDFAAADLLKRQRKFSESLGRFEFFVQSDSTSSLVDEALMNIGDLLAHLGRFTDAISTYERLMKNFPESLELDRALMKMAEIYRQGLKDNMKSADTYKRILEQYPNSIYVGEARKRIRELRGDTL